MLREAVGIKRVIIRCGRTDLRYGIDRLASLVQTEYGLDPLEEGTLFLFCGNKSDRIKGLLYEEGGFLLLMKRLSKGAFLWPRNVSEARELSHSAFDSLMRGYEITSSIKIYHTKEKEAEKQRVEDMEERESQEPIETGVEDKNREGQKRMLDEVRRSAMTA